MNHYVETLEFSRPWTCCAGCGGAAVNLEDVSLLVGSGADAPRRIVWEHPLCALCLEMLLSRNMRKYCPIDCRKTHG